VAFGPVFLVNLGLPPLYVIFQSFCQLIGNTINYIYIFAQPLRLGDRLDFLDAFLRIERESKVDASHQASCNNEDKNECGYLSHAALLSRLAQSKRMRTTGDP